MSLGLLALTVGGILLLAILILPRRRAWQLLSLFSSVSPVPVQLPINATFLLGLGTSLRDPIGKIRSLRGFIPVGLLALALTQFSSTLWSLRPPAALAIGSITLAVLAMVLFVLQGPRPSGQRWDLLHASALAIIPVAFVQALSTIIFRFDPGLENRYHTSPLITWLLGDEGRLLFTTLRNNVVDPLKAGGLLFVNGNKASMVMAVWALMYLSVCIRRRSFLYLLMFSICIAGTIATSSKTALFLAFSLIPLFLILPFVVRVRASPLGFVVGLLSAIGTSLGLATVVSFLSDELTGVDESAEDRSRLWSGAWRYFQESPLLGLGVGGWADRWGSDPAAAGRELLPPHNMLIMMWADSGLLAPLLVIAIYSVIAVRYIRAIARAASNREAVAVALELCAIAWIFAHGMYDNTNFYGDPHTAIFFAIVCARASTKAVPYDGEFPTVSEFKKLEDSSISPSMCPQRSKR